MVQVNDFKDILLFEVQKAFYDERGKGARYRLTMIGVPYLQEHLKEKSGDIEEIRSWLLENGFAENIQFEEETVALKLIVQNCCLRNITDLFDKAGMQPLGCPIANMFMNALELETGLSPELLPIKLEAGKCELTLAKMATSDVVEGMKK